MNRGLPLALLALFFMYLAANVSNVVIWSITGIAVFSLLALMFFMYQRGQFVGPGTLIDDARSIRDRFVADDEDEDAVVVLVDRDSVQEIRRTRD